MEEGSEGTPLTRFKKNYNVYRIVWYPEIPGIDSEGRPLITEREIFEWKELGVPLQVAIEQQDGRPVFMLDYHWLSLWHSQPVFPYKPVLPGKWATYPEGPFSQGWERSWFPGGGEIDGRQFVELGYFKSKYGAQRWLSQQLRYKELQWNSQGVSLYTTAKGGVGGGGGISRYADLTGKNAWKAFMYNDGRLDFLRDFQEDKVSGWGEADDMWVEAFIGRLGIVTEDPWAWVDYLPESPYPADRRARKEDRRFLGDNVIEAEFSAIDPRMPKIMDFFQSKEDSPEKQFWPIAKKPGRP